MHPKAAMAGPPEHLRPLPGQGWGPAACYSRLGLPPDEPGTQAEAGPLRTLKGRLQQAVRFVQHQHSRA